MMLAHSSDDVAGFKLLGPVRAMDSISLRDALLEVIARFIEGLELFEWYVIYLA